MGKVKGKKVVVAAGFDVVELVELDAKGDELIFDPQRFLELDEATVKGLSMANRQRYLVTKELAGELEKRNPVDDAVLATIGTGANLFKTAETAGSARQRLQIRNQNPKYDYKWVRPDMLDDYQAKGWEVDQSGELKTFRGSGKGPRTIKSMGLDELVVVRIAKTRRNELKKEKAVKRERALRTPEAQARNIISGLGSKVVDETTPFQPLPLNEA